MPSAEFSPSWQQLEAWQKPARSPSWAAVGRTRLHFLALALYVATQVYLIPLRPLGPSWAVWPRLADGAMFLLGLAALIGLPTWRALPDSHRRILWPLFAWVGLCAVSFLTVTLLLPRLGGLTHPSDKANVWGIYQLARLVQFSLLFLLAATVPLPTVRARWLGQLTALVLGLCCVLVVTTYFGLVPHPLLVAHLPQDPDVAGPWASFGATGDSGLGTISYNHAYVACQLMLLLMLRLSLTNCQFSVSNVALVLLTLAAVFFSGSRAGFGGMLVLLGGGLLPQWIHLGYSRRLLAIATFGAAAAAATAVLPNVGALGRVAQKLEDQGAIISRQLSVLEGFRSDNLSGRTEIWAHHLEEMNRQPWRWAIGGGFGAAVAAGNQAHMLALNVVVELGLIGLAVAVWLTWCVLQGLWLNEPPGKPLFWGTLALLLTSLTQETFYPVPALGHFLGLYLVAVAIALRVASDHPTWRIAEWRTAEVPS